VKAVGVRNVDSGWKKRDRNARERAKKKIIIKKKYNFSLHRGASG